MMEEKKYNNWIEALDVKTRLLMEKIIYLKEWAQKNSFEESVLNNLTEPYYEELDYIYKKEYPLANAIEKSDLVVRLEGPAIFPVNPSISSISKAFSKIIKEVSYVTKAIIGITEDNRKIKDIDLGLSALAEGSLILGFTIPEQGKYEGEQSLWGKEDVVYKASKEALKNIGIVTKFISENEDEEKIEEYIKDPKIRDASFIAAKSLIPSKRTGINSIGIGVKEVTENKLNKLNFENKKHINEFIRHPIKKLGEIMTFEGEVREIDLDANRFELRRIHDKDISDIRCIYGKDYSKSIKKFLAKKIIVTGKVELLNDKPRLMEIQTITNPDDKTIIKMFK